MVETEGLPEKNQQEPANPKIASQSGGVKLEEGSNVTIGSGDMVAGDKLQAGGHIIQVGPGGTVVINTSSDLPLFSDGQMIADDKVAPPPRHHYDPLPSLEYPMGAMQPKSPFYVEPQADKLLQEQVLGARTLTTIRAGRQAGKTSLLMQGIQTAQREKRPVIYFDLQVIEAKHRKTLGSLLKQLAVEIARQLKINAQMVDDIWTRSWSASIKFNEFLETSVLEDAKSPILLALDEADLLLSEAYRKDFFSLVWAWNSLGAKNPLWCKLNIAMVISTHPNLLIDDVTRSPFNVGMTIDLQDFDEAQVSDLNARHGDPVPPDLIPTVMNLLGGHPYLVRQAFYTLVKERWSWSDLAQKASSEQGPFGQHLRFYRNELGVTKVG